MENGDFGNDVEAFRGTETDGVEALGHLPGRDGLQEGEGGSSDEALR